MSVVMTLRATGDAGALERYASENPQLMQEITERAKGHGLISHHFYTDGDGTVMVIDEWETAEGFQAFFGSSPEIPEMMMASGVSAQPEITYWREMNTGDAYPPR